MVNLHRAPALALAAVLAAVLSPHATPASAATRPTWVVCAPGYPGSTVEAQPNMDAFASALASAAGWGRGKLAAVYHETETAGVERLSKPDAAFALVPLPFYLEHRGALALTPKLLAVSKGGDALESWTLVAKTGTVTSPASLAGWEIHSLAAYSPGFVRDVALGTWGRLPADVKLVPTGQVLSSLRRAASGEHVAVLLDASQAASVATLPFASKLETVARSAALPSAIVCAVDRRIVGRKLDALVSALTKLGDRADGAAALDGLRLSRFAAIDTNALESALNLFDAAAAKAPVAPPVTPR